MTFLEGFQSEVRSDDQAGARLVSQIVPCIAARIVSLAGEIQAEVNIHTPLDDYPPSCRSTRHP